MLVDLSYVALLITSILSNVSRIKIVVRGEGEEDGNDREQG